MSFTTTTNSTTSSSDDESISSNNGQHQLRTTRKSMCVLPSQPRNGPSTRREAARKASEAILASVSGTLSSGSTLSEASSTSGSSIGTSSFDKSMENFNPDMSQRETRKLNKKFQTLNAPTAATGTGKTPLPRPPLYDETGKHIPSGKDLCDCLSEKCPGCFFDCPKCGSQKCGTVCRVRRQYIVDQIEYHDGQEKIVENPLKKK